MTPAEIEIAAAGFIAQCEAIAAAAPAPFDLAPLYSSEDNHAFHHSADGESRRVYNYYAAYGRAFRPRRILEIGVRRGYSALALIKGAGTVAGYVGIDSERELPGGNALAQAGLRAACQCDIEVQSADTQTRFPQLLPNFDLAHVDGAQSGTAVAGDLLHVGPLLRLGGVIILGDARSPGGAAGLDIALAAFGPRVIRRDAGDMRRQALLFVKARLPAISLAAATAMAPGQRGLAASIELQMQLLRQIGAGGAAVDESQVLDVFQKLLAGHARRLERVQDAPMPDASAMFRHFAEFAAGLHGAGNLAAEARRHITYAVERLADADLPAAYGTCGKVHEPFAAGTSGHGQMLCEIARNLGELLAQQQRDSGG